MIHELLITDPHQDTLLYLPALYIDFSYKPRRHTLTIYRAQFIQPLIKLNTYVGEKEMNLIQWINSFPSGHDTSHSPSSFQLQIKQLLLREGRFHMNDFNSPPIKSHHQIDFTHLHINQLNLLSHNPSFLSDTIQIPITHLSASEKSGFNIKKLQGLLSISEKGIELLECSLNTSHSILHGNFSLQTDHYNDYNQFEEKVYLKLAINPSTLSPYELRYFGSMDSLFSPSDHIAIQGKIKGTLKNLKIRELTLTYGDQSHFKGDLELKGLPDVSNTLILASIDNLRISATDMNHITPLQPLLKEHTTLLNRLSAVSFQGKVQGFLTDLTIYGHTTNHAGTLHTDINIKQTPSQLLLSGHVSCPSFHITSLFPDSPVESIGFDYSLSFRYSDQKQFLASLNAKIHHLSYNRYNYQNIHIDGQITPKSFSGTMNIDDPNISLSYKGSIDFRQKPEQLNFEIQIHKLRPYLLHFPSPDSAACISGDIIIHTTGLNPDNITGNIELVNIHYKGQQDTFLIDDIDIFLDKFDSLTTVVVNSTPFKIEMTGKYKLSLLPHYFLHNTYTFLPEFISKPSLTPEKTNFYINTTLEINPQADRLIHLFYPNLSITDPLYLRGYLRHNYTDITGHTDLLTLHHKQLHEVHVKIASIDTSLYANIAIEQLKLDDSLAIDHLHIHHLISNNHITGNINWENISEKKNDGDINYHLFFTSDKIFFRIDSSYTHLNENFWQIISSDWGYKDSSTIVFAPILATDGTGYIKIYGNSNDEKEPVTLEIAKFNLGYLNQMSSAIPPLKGLLHTRQQLKQKNSTWLLNGTVRIDSLHLQNLYLGECSFSNDGNEATGSFSLQGDMIRNQEKVLELHSYLFRNKQGNPEMSHTIHFTKTELVLLEPFLKGVLSELSGQLGGTIQITGNIEHPSVTANLEVEDIALKVDYLNTKYRIPGKNMITIEPDWIGLNNIRVYDEKNNLAELNANILHKNFKNFNYDIGLYSKKFLFLNTKPIHNNIFYGTALMSGMVNISGTQEKTLIEAQVKTLPGTTLNIPLSNPEEISEFGFVNFISIATPQSIPDKSNKNETSALILNFDIEATPDAEVRMIFDEKIGDILRTRGSGNLTLFIDENNSFSMFGDYKISEGDYLFTMQNLINKKFILEKGGEIRWNGDPLNGEINLYASYNTKASLDQLLNDSSQNFKKRVPVNVKMHLFNKLAQPDVEFEIELPTIDETSRQRVNTILMAGGESKNNPEITRQVFSLLVLNRFAPPSGSESVTSSGGNAGLQNSTELLSNQISNWMNQFSKQIDMGLSYRKGNTSQKDEVELSMSTQLLNDRITIDGSLGYVNTSTAHANTVVGDVSVEYKITRDGKIRARAFNRSNNNLNNNISPYTQGIGFIYRLDFTNLKELFRKKKTHEN